MEGDGKMDFNVRFDKMSKAMKTQLFIDNLTMIFNPQALFSDGTPFYRIPSEPGENELVRIRFRSARENVDEVYLVCGNDRRTKYAYSQSVGCGNDGRGAGVSGIERD